MLHHLSNPGIQMIALLVLAGLVFIVTVACYIKACIKLKTKGKSISEIADEGERVKTQLERFTDNISDDNGGWA